MNPPFVGARLPENVRSQLSTICRGIAGVLWHSKDQFVLRLRGLDELGPSDIGRAIEIIDSLSPTDISIGLRGVSFSSPGELPEMIRIGVLPAPGLNEYLERLEGRLEAEGIRIHKVQMAPHVLLGRFGPGPMHSHRPAPRAEFLATSSQFRSETFRLDDVGVFSSIRSDNGPAYRMESVAAVG